MQRRDARFEVRLTSKEKELLEKKAAQYGMTPSEYARALLIHSDDAAIRVIDVEPLRKVAHELAKQGTNLNQFMRFLNTYGKRAFDEKEAAQVLEQEVAMFHEVAEALAALRREADRNNLQIRIADFDMEEEV